MKLASLQERSCFVRDVSVGCLDEVSSRENFLGGRLVYRRYQTYRVSFLGELLCRPMVNTWSMVEMSSLEPLSETLSNGALAISRSLLRRLASTGVLVCALTLMACSKPVETKSLSQMSTDPTPWCHDVSYVDFEGRHRARICYQSMILCYRAGNNIRKFGPLARVDGVTDCRKR